MCKKNKNAKQNSNRQHLHIFHTVQVYKEHEMKYKPLTILHFLWSSGFNPVFLLSVTFDVASSSGMKTSLINPFSIFHSDLLADKQFFWRLNKLVLHTFKFSFFYKNLKNFKLKSLLYCIFFLPSCFTNPYATYFWLKYVFIISGMCLYY